MQHIQYNIKIKKKPFIPCLNSILLRNHWIVAAGFALTTEHTSVSAWFSRTSTLELCAYPWISMDDGGAANKTKKNIKN